MMIANKLENFGVTSDERLPDFDRIEEMAWARHYQQIVREEKETELADDLEKGLR
ncbi:host-nuclease inhibitor protein gam [Shigella sonnei 53G]|nr:host-nuclease inhibitor protein gam [Shigella sonnei 53G]